MCIGDNTIPGAAGGGEPETMRAEALTSSLLSSAGFAHGFATRRGGVSRAPFDTLNFRIAEGERTENVAENVRRFAAEVGFTPSELYLVNQVHGSRVLVAGERGATLGHEDADAVVVGGGNAGGVRVADCVPILVGDLVTGRAAAIHAGWRGIEAGGIGAALATLGDSRSTRVAAIGPCIGACCFEVGTDVAERIVRAASEPDACVGASGGKAHVDLRLAARAQLRAHGLSNGDIDDVVGCTRCDKERFFSFRRDGAASGRHLAAIRARG
jgi:polyphenol oxidase